MTSIFDEATPRGSWLAALTRDWDVAVPVADDLLRHEHGAHESDARLETISAWFRVDPTTAVQASMALAVGRPDDAADVLRASLQTFLTAFPEWEVAGLRTPTRRQVLRQWGSSRDNALAETIDGFSAATLREVARKHLKEGKALPPRARDDDGGHCAFRPRAPHISHSERGGIPITTVHADPLDDESSGAMPTPRPMARRVIGGPDSPPHPRFSKAQEHD